MTAVFSTHVSAKDEFLIQIATMLGENIWKELFNLGLGIPLVTVTNVIWLLDNIYMCRVTSLYHKNLLCYTALIKQEQNNRRLLAIEAESIGNQFDLRNEKHRAYVREFNKSIGGSFEVDPTFSLSYALVDSGTHLRLVSCTIGSSVVEKGSIRSLGDIFLLLGRLAKYQQFIEIGWAFQAKTTAALYKRRSTSSNSWWALSNKGNDITQLQMDTVQWLHFLVGLKWHERVALLSQWENEGRGITAFRYHLRALLMLAMSKT